MTARPRAQAGEESPAYLDVPCFFMVSDDVFLFMPSWAVPPLLIPVVPVVPLVAPGVVAPVAPVPSFILPLVLPGLFMLSDCGAGPLF